MSRNSYCLIYAYYERNGSVHASDDAFHCWKRIMEATVFKEKINKNREEERHQDSQLVLWRALSEIQTYTNNGDIEANPTNHMRIQLCGSSRNYHRQHTTSHFMLRKIKLWDPKTKHTIHIKRIRMFTLGDEAALTPHSLAVPSTRSFTCNWNQQNFQETQKRDAGWSALLKKEKENEKRRFNNANRKHFPRNPRWTPNCPALPTGMPPGIPVQLRNPRVYSQPDMYIC